MDMGKLWDDTPTSTLKISCATPFVLRSTPTPTPPPRLTNTTPAPSRSFELQTFLRYIAGFAHIQISGTLYSEERQALVVVIITIIGSFLPISLAYRLASCQRPLDSMRRPPISEAHDIGERLIGEGRFDRKTYRRIKRLLAKDKARINHIANLRLKSLRILHGQELKVADEENLKLTDEQELIKTDKQELTKADEQELTETDEQDLTETDEQELTKTNEQDLTKVDEPDLTETDEQGFTKTDERPASATVNLAPNFGRSLHKAEKLLRIKIGTIDMTENSRAVVFKTIRDELHLFTEALNEEYSRLPGSNAASLTSDDKPISHCDGVEKENGTKDIGAEIQHNGPAERKPSRFIGQAHLDLPNKIGDAEVTDEALKGQENSLNWLKWKLACMKGGHRTPDGPEPTTGLTPDIALARQYQEEAWAEWPLHDTIKDCEQQIDVSEVEIACKKRELDISQPSASPKPKHKGKGIVRTNVGKAPEALFEDDDDE